MALLVHRINLYTKEGCCLCDEARDVLAKLTQEFRLAVTELDITTDGELYERFKYVIPVVEIDGATRLGARFSEADLRHAILDMEQSDGEGGGD